MSLTSPGTPSRSESSYLATALTWLALALAIGTAAGGLLLTLKENKIACPLCFYQRTFALGIVGILGVGLFSGTTTSGRLAALALPLALGGTGVAAFHVSLELRGILECPSGLFEIGTAPTQSLLANLVLTLTLFFAVSTGIFGMRRLATLALATAFGAGLVWAATAANPPLPAPPKEKPEGPPTTCRRPYEESGKTE